MGSPVVHWEMYAKSAEKTSAFYKQVFDWGVQVIPEMNYHLVNTGGAGGINGGIMQHQEGLPDGTVMYINVDDLDAYGKKVVAAGGTLIVEKQDVPGMGTFTLFTDLDGRINGLWKAAM